MKTQQEVNRRSIYNYTEDYEGAHKTYVGWYDIDASYTVYDERNCNHDGEFFVVTKSGKLVKCYASQWANIDDSCQMSSLNELVERIGVGSALVYLKYAQNSQCNCNELMTELGKLITQSEM